MENYMKSTLFALVAAVALVACGKKETAAPAPAAPATVTTPAPAAAPAATPAASEPAKTDEAKK